MRSTSSDLSDADVRRRLSALGKRREKLRKLEEELAEEISGLLPAARLSKVSMEEAAKRLGLNRTTLYQVYLPSDARRTARSPASAS